MANTGRAQLTHFIVPGSSARVGVGLANFGTLELNNVTLRGNAANIGGLCSGRKAMLTTRWLPARLHR